jgi:NAD(P)-dependent dehydrogenase (short-subunit alcohol dehydrogenase family)
MQELQGKVAVVTGASRGIGAATARVLAERGAKVFLTARTGDAIEALAAEIVDTGGEALALPADVARFADVEAVVTAASERFGRLDIVVNNAGAIEPIARLADSDPAAWAAAFDVNAKGVYHGLRAAIPAMLTSGGGVVVNISSGAAVNALEGWSHYCAGKAAALMLTRAAYQEYGQAGIRVVGLSPGTVATDMQVAIKRSGMNGVSRLDWSDHIPPEWAARAVAWLCTDAGATFDGGDMSLRDEANRRLVGLVP